MEFPSCVQCLSKNLGNPRNGVLVPLSDYGADGAAVTYKAWTCTNPDCDFTLRIDKGTVARGTHAPRNGEARSR